MAEEDINFQIGASDVDRSPVTDSGDFYPFEMEARAIFKRLAEDIYPSPKSGIRESLTNAITATLRATDEYNLQNDECVVRYRLVERSGGKLLIIEDNGVGMTIDKVNRVVSYIGRSTVRDDWQKTGQFGMGFLALFSLCGTDGGFVMHTNSRKPQTESITGIWKDGGFSKEDTSEKAKNMKGTRFEVYLKDSISTQDVRNWISEVSEFSRVPVIYEEEVQGNIESEEFGGETFEESIDPENPMVTYEDEYVKVTSSPEVDKHRTILLDVPIELGRNYVPLAPWNSYVRLKTENPIVVEGENEGKMVVPEVEYTGMSDERQEKYIPANRVEDSDVVSPSVVGNREKLSKSDDFWQYVGEKLREKHVSMATERIGKLESGSGIDNWSIVSKLIPQNLSSFDRFKSICKNVLENPSDETINILFAVHREVKIVRENSFVEKPAIELIDKDSVYMTTEDTKDEKYDYVFSQDEVSEIVELQDSDWYQFYSEILDWNRLADVDIGDNSEQSETRGNKESSEPSERSQTIRVRSNLSRTVELDEIIESVSEDSQGHFIRNENVGISQKIRRLYVIFSGDEINVSDYIWMANEDGVAITEADRKSYDEIIELPVSIDLSDEISRIQKREFMTSEGRLSYSSIQPSTSVFHIIDDDYKSDFISHTNDCEKMSNILRMDFIESTSDIAYDNYVLMTTNEYFQNLPILKNAKTIVCSDVNLGISGTIDGPNMQQCRLYMKAYDNRDNEIIQKIGTEILNDSTESVSSSFINLVEWINKSDADLDKVVDDD